MGAYRRRKLAAPERIPIAYVWFFQDFALIWETAIGIYLDVEPFLIGDQTIAKTGCDNAV